MTTTRPPIPNPEDTLFAKGVSVCLWVVALLWLVPMMLTMMGLALLLHPRKTDWLNRLYCRGQVALTGSKWRAVVHPSVDPKTPYIFMQNHTNHFDHVVFYDATPHFKQGLELEKHFKYPVYGWFMKSRGTIPVRKGVKGQLDGIRGSVKSRTHEGDSILVFPEGTRTRTGHIEPFRKGMFVVARDLGIPVVPVTVTGMYRVMRKGNHLIHPGREVTVFVDAPIATKGLSDEDLDGVVTQTHRVMTERMNTYWETQGVALG